MKLKHCMSTVSFLDDNCLQYDRLEENSRYIEFKNLQKNESWSSRKTD